MSGRFILQDTVPDRVVRGFKNEPQGNVCAAIASHGETDCVAGAFPRETSAI